MIRVTYFKAKYGAAWQLQTNLLDSLHLRIVFIAGAIRGPNEMYQCGIPHGGNSVVRKLTQLKAGRRRPGRSDDNPIALT